MNTETFAAPKPHSIWLTRFLIVACLGTIYGTSAYFVGYFAAIIVTMLVGGFVASRLLLKPDQRSSQFENLKWLAFNDQNRYRLSYSDQPVIVQWDNDRCWVRAKDVFAVMHMDLTRKTCRRLAATFGETGFFHDKDDQWWFSEIAVHQWLGNHEFKFSEHAKSFRSWLVNDGFRTPRSIAEIQGGILRNKSAEKAS